jgi:DNA-binding IclR family transcriptional regulator
MSQSLDRGLRLLDEIAAGRTTLAEMSESLGVHKSTVLRLLFTLQQHHFVYREDAHNYRLGRRLFDLASFALESRHIAALARPAMRRLTQATDQAVYLAVLEAGQVVVVEVSANRGRSHVALRVGESLPLHATASGKALLAGSPPDAVDDLLRACDFAALTSATATAPDQLREELEEIRASGFAIELAEHEDYVSALASVVRDSTGTAVAAMALTVPGVSVSEQAVTRYTPQLFAACSEVSLELGWH